MKKYGIITIERQYASGGRTIGRMLAEALRIPCYGHEILELAARRSGMSAEYLEHIEESASNSMLYSLVISPEAALRGADVLPPADRLFMVESEIIRELSDREDCVLIGHAASSILAERSDCLHVFIYADSEARITRAVNEYGVSEKDAPALLRKYDKRRANFYNANYSLGWEDKNGYHMMLDSGKLGVEACTQMILSAVRKEK